MIKVRSYLVENKHCKKHDLFIIKSGQVQPQNPSIFYSETCQKQTLNKPQICLNQSFYEVPSYKFQGIFNLGKK